MPTEVKELKGFYAQTHTLIKKVHYSVQANFRMLNNMSDKALMAS